MKKKKKSVKRILLLVLSIVLLCCTILYIAKYFYEKKETEKVPEILNEIKIDETQITEQKTERMLQIEELKKENSDIVGWIEIEGTNISYPVLQTTNNEYYMKKDYKKEYNYNGSLFLDKDYDWSIPSANLLIYGHNNKNDCMFAQLLKYKDESFYKEHSKFRFTTAEEDAEYEIISAFFSRVYYKSETNAFRYYYFVNAENEESFNQYITDCKKESIYDTGKTAVYGEQLITLSTCSYHTEDGRFAVVAKKIK